MWQSLHETNIFMILLEFIMNIVARGGRVFSYTFHWDSSLSRVGTICGYSILTSYLASFQVLACFYNINHLHTRVLVTKTVKYTQGACNTDLSSSLWFTTSFTCIKGFSLISFINPWHFILECRQILYCLSQQGSPYIRIHNLIDHII